MTTPNYPQPAAGAALAAELARTEPDPDRAQAYTEAAAILDDTSDPLADELADAAHLLLTTLGFPAAPAAAADHAAVLAALAAFAELVRDETPPAPARLAYNHNRADLRLDPGAIGADELADDVAAFLATMNTDELARVIPSAAALLAAGAGNGWECLETAIIWERG